MDAHPEEKKTTCPSGFAIDRWLIDGRSEADPLAAHVRGCARCAATVAEFEAADAEFRREVFPATAEKVVANVQSVPWYQRIVTRDYPLDLRVIVPLLAVVVVGLTATFIAMPASRDNDVYTGIKGPSTVLGTGGVGLMVFVRQGAEVREVKDGDTLAPGDPLRFSPAVPRDGYLMIVSIEGADRLNMFYPVSGDQAMKVGGGGVPLPGAIVLDDSKGPERIFLLFSTRPFPVSEVAAAVQRARASGGVVAEIKTLPLDLQQATLLIRK